MVVMKSKLVMKKLFVCVLSVLMLVMMCSVGVAAAGQSYTLTVEGLGDRIITGGIAKNEGGHISNFGDGATVTIVGVDLTDIGAVTIVGNSGAANGVKVEMRLDNETGTLLGTFTASGSPHYKHFHFGLSSQQNLWLWGKCSPQSRYLLF